MTPKCKSAPDALQHQGICKASSECQLQPRCRKTSHAGAGGWGQDYEQHSAKLCRPSGLRRSTSRLPSSHIRRLHVLLDVLRAPGSLAYAAESVARLCGQQSAKQRQAPPASCHSTSRWPSSSTGLGRAGCRSLTNATAYHWRVHSYWAGAGSLQTTPMQVGPTTSDKLADQQSH